MAQRNIEHERREQRAELEVTSEAFGDGEQIPARYTADGENVSPPLAWSAPPPSTRSFAIVCEDPDAPSGRFVHWLAWGIQESQRVLDEGSSGAVGVWGMRQGENGFGDSRYGGPKPPPGKPHRYLFRIYALDHGPELLPGSSRAELEHAIDGHVVAEGVLTGTYGG